MGTQAADHISSENQKLLSRDLKANIVTLQTDFGHSPDLIINLAQLRKNTALYASVYLTEMIDHTVINSISNELSQIDAERIKSKSESVFDFLLNTVTKLRATRSGNDYTKMYEEILSGNTVFLVDGYDIYISVSTASDEGRAISEPTTQTVIKGPKDAFTENIDKNVFMIRSRVRNEALRIEDITLGTVTHTKVKLLYFNGIAKKDIVDDLRSRVSKINYDGVLGSNYIEEIIKTDPYSIFPTILNSERPDTVAAGLLEGRVAILCDGTPYVLLEPALFSDFLQSGDDYYENFYVQSLIRIIRYIALIFTLLVPAVFIALVTFHQEIIPTPLLISIAAQREGVPFPAVLEVLLMDLTFEILREAGVRMPRAIGSAISIVGALVLGQAAVEAGLVSAATVIVVALTAISSFAITNYAMSNAVRLLRFAFICIAGILGLYGISMGLIILLLHLCKLKSASVPYLTPAAPYIKGANKDTLVRFPLFKLKFRPAGISGTGKARTNGRNTMDPNITKKPEIR
ncbi:spore germination protein KA [Sporobacter termitidis DSM 10068]|uniref:Spore germination protein KA n=1 Tax=Sporobacter termitidis DSM 10068 TaxID=1123282 RepID=A0A1M5VJH0_9FIRM|nr:spore germination protein [Sporobacter termitidis]SHH75063.1 spore germination protein KA [Sporobacter termitidis DSM 10068]